MRPRHQEKRRLSREEEKKVANWIVDKNPAQLKFDFALWTAKAVRQLIYREFGRQFPRPFNGTPLPAFVGHDASASEKESDSAG